MKRLTLALLVLAGCGGGNSDPFVGTWSCMGTSMVTYTQPAGMMPATNMNSQTTMISDDGTGKLTIMRMPSMAPPCTNTAHLNADKISFVWDAGQTCMLNNGITQTFTQVTAEITSTGYSNTSAYTLSGTNLMATATATGACTKM
jgi:hypothetical protein